MAMRIFKISIVLIACFAMLTAYAQDPQFSQYYQAPLYLNPGFTGITQQQRIAVNHRIQWPSLPQAFSTYAASYDIFVNDLRSGFGFLVTTDKMGSGGWRTTTAGMLYSYKVRLSNKFVFSPGLYFGYGVNGLDRSKLVLGDQLRYRNDNQSSTDPELRRLGTQSYFDFGSGFLLYSRTVWLGGSFMHMNQPNLSVLNDVSRLPLKTSIHAGAKLSLGNAGPRTMSKVSYLTPSFIYRMQGNTFSQLDIGVNYHVDPVSVGLWYRGKPWQQTVSNTVAQDAMILQLGLLFQKFTVGYSYDFTISDMQTASGGAHEISLVMEFVAKPMRGGVKKKNRLIPCPTFSQKPGFWN